MGFLGALVVLIILFKVRPKTLLGNWFRFTGAFTLYIFFILLKEYRRDPPPLFLGIIMGIGMPLLFGVVIGSLVFGVWFFIKKLRKPK